MILQEKIWKCSVFTLNYCSLVCDIYSTWFDAIGCLNQKFEGLFKTSPALVITASCVTRRVQLLFLHFTTVYWNCRWAVDRRLLPDKEIEFILNLILAVYSNIRFSCCFYFSTLQLVFYYHMYGSGFTETLDNPNPGKLQLQMRLSSRTITIWVQSADMGSEWQLANVYIGKFNQYSN